LLGRLALFQSGTLLGLEAQKGLGWLARIAALFAAMPMLMVLCWFGSGAIFTPSYCAAATLTGSRPAGWGRGSLWAALFLGMLALPWLVTIVLGPMVLAARVADAWVYDLPLH
jgi:hypothetical protein